MLLKRLLNQILKWDTIGNHKSFVTSVGKTPASIFTRVKDVMFTIYVSFVMKGYLQNFCYIKALICFALNAIVVIINTCITQPGSRFVGYISCRAFLIQCWQNESDLKIHLYNSLDKNGHGVALNIYFSYGIWRNHCIK